MHAIRWAFAAGAVLSVVGVYGYCSSVSIGFMDTGVRAVGLLDGRLVGVFPGRGSGLWGSRVGRVAALVVQVEVHDVFPWLREVEDGVQQ